MSFEPLEYLRHIRNEAEFLAKRADAGLNMENVDPAGPSFTTVLPNSP